jgi:long-chain fatty acid transport protein
MAGGFVGSEKTGAGVAAALAFLCMGAPARAAGFYIQEQSVRGDGRAFSGEVADVGPESLWWNPAAIATSPETAYGAISGIFPSSDVDDRGSTLTLPIPPAGLTVPVGGRPHAGDPIEAVAVGAAGWATPVGERFAVGLSVAAPFGEAIKYQPDSFARYGALTSRLSIADLQLTGAYKAADWVDLGLGLDAIYVNARLTNALPNLVPGAPDGFSELKGSGWDWGWVVGARFHPSKGDQWSVGVSYRAAVRHEFPIDVSLSGLVGPLAGANANTFGSARFTTPWIATIGARYRVRPDLTLDAQVQHFGWSEFKDLRVEFPGVIQSIPQDFRDTTTAAVGLDYVPCPRGTVRAGVQWDPTPTPDNGRSLRLPDSDRWLFALGGEYGLGAHFTLEGAVEYVDFQGAQVNNQPVFFQGTPAQTSAHYLAQSTGHAAVVSIGGRWRF